MSLISLLLALSPPLAARFKKPDETDRLKAELAKAKEDITELRRERDMWRGRAYEAVPPRDMQNAQYQQAMAIAQYQAAMQQSPSLALQNAQMAQQSQNSPQYLLGAQNLNVLNPEMFCNCVPARHDLLLLG